MPKKPPAPSDLADKFMLRMPDGMRDRIAEAAKASGRSMNAEFVHRLERTFEGPTLVTKQELEEITAEMHRRFEEALRDPDAIMGRGDTVFVVLDTNGMPISWDEIREHIAAINEEGGFKPVNQAVRVITPELESSSDTNKRTVDLARNYRKLLKRKP